MLKSLFPWKHGKHNKTKVMAEQTMEEGEVQEQQLLPCHVCGRTFLPLPLQKHTPICEKHATKKRKVFDSLKQRVEGTDLAPFHQRSYLKKTQESVTPEICPNKQNSKWKEKHLELVNAIRAAKGVSVTMATPAQKRTHMTAVSSTHERCPSCDRQFGPKAFDRHVEWCREHKARIQKSPANQLAKERLEARTKYKVPPLRQSKRSITREKYSPTSVSRTESITSVKSTSTVSNFQRSPSIRKPRSVVSLNKVGEGPAGAERRDKSLSKIEKCGDDATSVKQRDSPSDKAIPKEIIKYSPKLETPKSFQTKRVLPAKRINSPRVNTEVEGMTVSPLVLHASVGGKKMVTWKDTLDAAKEEGNVKINSVVKPEALSDRIQLQLNFEENLAEHKKLSTSGTVRKRTDRRDSLIAIRSHKNSKKEETHHQDKIVPKADEEFCHKKLEDIEIDKRLISDKLIKKRTVQALNKYKLSKDCAEKGLSHLQNQLKAGSGETAKQDVKTIFAKTDPVRNVIPEMDDRSDNPDHGYTGSGSSEGCYDSSGETIGNSHNFKAKRNQQCLSDSGVMSEDLMNLNVSNSFREETSQYKTIPCRDETKINKSRLQSLNTASAKTDTITNGADINLEQRKRGDFNNSLINRQKGVKNVDTTRESNNKPTDIEEVVTITVLENHENKFYYIAEVTPRAEYLASPEDKIEVKTPHPQCLFKKLSNSTFEIKEIEHVLPGEDSDNVSPKRLDNGRETSRYSATKQVRFLAKIIDKTCGKHDTDLHCDKGSVSSVEENDDFDNNATSTSNETLSTNDYKKEIEIYLTSDEKCNGNEKQDLYEDCSKMPSAHGNIICRKCQSSPNLAKTLDSFEKCNGKSNYDLKLPLDNSQTSVIDSPCNSDNIGNSRPPMPNKVPSMSSKPSLSDSLSKDSIEEALKLRLDLPSRKSDTDSQTTINSIYIPTFSNPDIDETCRNKSPQLVVIHECNELEEKEPDNKTEDVTVKNFMQNESCSKKSFVSLYRNENSKKSDVDSVDIRCLYYDNVKSELKLRPCKSDVLLRKSSPKFVTTTHYDLSKYASLSSTCSDACNYTISDVCSNPPSDSSLSRHKILEIAANEFIDDYQRNIESTASTSAEEFEYCVPKKRRRLEELPIDLTNADYINEQFSSTGSVYVSNLEYLQSNIKKIKHMRSEKLQCGVQSEEMVSDLSKTFALRDDGISPDVSKTCALRDAGISPDVSKIFALRDNRISPDVSKTSVLRDDGISPDVSKIFAVRDDRISPDVSKTFALRDDGISTDVSQTFVLRDGGISPDISKIFPLRDDGICPDVSKTCALRDAGISPDVSKIFALRDNRISPDVSKTSVLRDDGISPDVSKIFAVRDDRISPNVSKTFALRDDGISTDVSQTFVLRDGGISPDISKIFPLRDDGICPDVSKTCALRDAGISPDVSKIFALRDDGISSDVSKTSTLRDNGIPPDVSKTFALRDDGISPDVDKIFALKDDGISPDVSKTFALRDDISPDVSKTFALKESAESLDMTSYSISPVLESYLPERDTSRKRTEPDELQTFKLRNRFASAPPKKTQVEINLDDLYKPLPPLQININLDDKRLPALRLPKRPPSSASSTKTCDIEGYTPRLLMVLDRISRLNNRYYAPDEHADVDPNSVLEVPITVCEKLLDINKKKLPRLFRKLEERRNIKKYEEPVKLPKIDTPTFQDPVNANRQRNCINSPKNSCKVLEGILNGVTNKSLKCRLNKERIRSADVTSNREYRVGKFAVCRSGNADRTSGRSESNPYSTTPQYDPFVSAQRQFMELLQCDDFKAFNITNQPIQHSPRPHTTEPTKHSPIIVKKTIKSAETHTRNVSNDGRNNKRGSVIDPPHNFQDIIDTNADIYINDKLQNLNDDFELIENMINKQYIENINNEPINNHNFQIPSNNNIMTNSIDLKTILSERKYSDDMSSSSIDPCLINDNDNLSIPEHLHVEQYSPTSTIDTDVTLRNEDDNANNDIYSVQYDKRIASLESEILPKHKSVPEMKRSVSAVSRASTNSTHSNQSTQSNKSMNRRDSFRKSPSPKIKTKKSPQKSDSSTGKSKDKKNNLLSLKKTLSLLDPTPKPSMKNREDVNNYFEEQQAKSPSKNQQKLPEKEIEVTVQQSTEIRLPIRAEDLFAVDDEMYEEYKKYEEMYLKEKREKASSKKQRQKSSEITYGLVNASEEEDPVNQSNKLNNDSAYGSLNRKTPKHRTKSSKLSPLEQKHGVDSTSSSGSEHNPVSPVISPNNPKVSPNMKMSKFCHECGNKYPLDTAKFCVECGVRRLVL